MKIIKILDEGHDRYTLSVPDNCLGRMYDNNAEYITVEKPANEANSICTMIVTCMDVVVDHINVDNEPIPIRSNISQYENIRIGFAFTKADGYTKNTETKKFKFLEAQKPDEFVPVEPAQKVSIEYLLQFGFSAIEKEGTQLKFLNVDNEVVSSIDLATFSQVQADMAEEDEDNVAYIKNKSTKNMKNEGEDGTSPYVTQKYLEEHGGKINKIFVNGEELSPDEAKTIYLSIITKAVDDLINYYKKSEIDGKFDEFRALLSAVPKFNIKVVDMLPMENIDSFTIYLLRSTDPAVSDLFTEFIYVNAGWECLGSQKIDLSEYPKLKDLAKIATTGKLSDAISDELHRTVRDEEKEYWNNKANKSDIPTTVASLNGLEPYMTRADVINLIEASGCIKCENEIDSIMNGTYKLNIAGLEGKPKTIQVEVGKPLSEYSDSLNEITAYDTRFSEETETVVDDNLQVITTTYPRATIINVEGYARFMYDTTYFEKPGLYYAEIVFVSTNEDYYDYRDKVAIEVYENESQE